MSRGKRVMGPTLLIVHLVVIGLVAGWLVLAPPAPKAEPSKQLHSPSARPSKKLPPAGDVITGGYVIRDIALGDEPDPVTGTPLTGHVRVRYNPEWAADFPGTHRCVWRVLDERGSAIGEAVRYMTAMQASYTTPIYTDVDIAGVPQSATVECDAKRLDDPDGNYRFTNLRVSPGDRLADLNLKFDYEWIGSGSPTPQECEVGILSTSGTPLFESHVNFFGLQTGVAGSTFALQIPKGIEVQGVPAAATVQCVPIGT
jgi:hypothetical protein